MFGFCALLPLVRPSFYPFVLYDLFFVDPCFVMAENLAF